MAALPLSLRPTTVASLSPPPVLVPPINFALVAPGVYRSGHPNRRNFGFLARLGLKTVVYVEDGDEYRKDGADFVAQHGLTLHRFDLSDEEALFTPSGRARLYQALAVLLDTRNHPLLVHDDTGKAAVTLVCALVRCFQAWALTAVYAEGDMFAGAGGSEGGGVGNAGREFIAMFDPTSVVLDRGHVPPWARARGL
ncbi:uncharacterized protein EHS24_001354 [Apiotrichum porosum]|uniref:Uncharacterized protein n=1 Tax=Apiotrichum porosum TaxID=105984 RepID=A0A427XKM2_9TREE|nr:uncharacterized protein EHS24_001354 [Apiotrichum porosum]RSH79314.1 hypothetical protein EHS24_001354 [Apiotrichum porosum]